MVIISGFTQTTDNPFVLFPTSSGGNDKTYFTGLTNSGSTGNYYYNQENVYIFQRIGDFANANGSITIDSGLYITAYLVGGGGNGNNFDAGGGGGGGGAYTLGIFTSSSLSYNISIGGSATSTTFGNYSAAGGTNGSGSGKGKMFRDNSLGYNYFYGGGGGSNNGNNNGGGNGYNSLGGISIQAFSGAGGGGYNHNGGNDSGGGGGYYSEGTPKYGAGGGPNGGAPGENASGPGGGGGGAYGPGGNGGLLGGGGGAQGGASRGGNGGAGGGGGGGSGAGGGNGGAGGGGGAGGTNRGSGVGGNGGPGGGGGGGSNGNKIGGSGGVGLLVLVISSSPPSPPCFLNNSKILTNKGYRPIQDLRKGDLVKTYKHYYKSIDMIGKSKITHHAYKERIKNQLYKCSKNQYPELNEDLIITGCHSILVDNFKSNEQINKAIELNGDRLCVTDDKLRLQACLDDRATVYETPGEYTVYHLALENENYFSNYGIYANGLLVETCSKRYLKELSGMDLIE